MTAKNRQNLEYHISLGRPIPNFGSIQPDLGGHFHEYITLGNFLVKHRLEMPGAP